MAKPSRFSKRNKTYRQDSDIADLIERAAAIIGCSEADLVDDCCERQLPAVIKARLMRRAMLRDPQTAAALAAIFKATRAKKK